LPDKIPVFGFADPQSAQDLRFFDFITGVFPIVAFWRVTLGRQNIDCLLPKFSCLLSQVIQLLDIGNLFVEGFHRFPQSVATLNDKNTKDYNLRRVQSKRDRVQLPTLKAPRAANSAFPKSLGSCTCIFLRGQVKWA
jgi:hypothetical protein